MRSVLAIKLCYKTIIEYGHHAYVNQTNACKIQTRKKTNRERNRYPLATDGLFQDLTLPNSVVMSQKNTFQFSTGSRYAVQATIGSELVIVFLVFSFAASSGVVEYLLKALQVIGYSNIACFVIVSIFFAYVLGRKTGIAIDQNTRNRFYLGYKTGLLVTIYSTLTASLFTFGTTFITTGLPADWFMLYIAKPLVWMICLSCLPILIAGSWYGFTIAKSAGK